MKGVKMESDTETMVEQKKINPENKNNNQDNQNKTADLGTTMNREIHLSQWIEEEN